MLKQKTFNKVLLSPKEGIVNLSTLGVILVAILMTAAEIWVWRESRKRAKQDPTYDERMRKAFWSNRLFPVLFFLLVPSPTSAQTWVEQRTDVTAAQATPRVDGWVSGTITPTIGTFAWFQADKNYAEAYVGPSFSPKPWLQFGVGAGVEQTTDPFRVGSFVWAGNKKASLLFIGEGMGSGWWYKAEFNWIAARNLGIGLMSERFKGTGPRIQYAVPHTPLTLWTSVLFQKEGNRAIVGIRAKM